VIFPKSDLSDMEYRQELIVDYLLRYNRVEALLSWLDKVDDVDHSLLQDIHQQLSKTTSYSQTRIIQHCARYVFVLPYIQCHVSSTSIYTIFNVINAYASISTSLTLFIKYQL